MDNRRHQIIALLCVLLFLCGVGYLRGRARTMADMQTDIDATNQAREELAAVVPALQAETVRPHPDPSPDLTGWLEQSALTGLERRVVTNQRSSTGQGVTLHLRDLQPKELAHLLNVMTSVNLQLKQFQMEDFAGAGKWDVTMTLVVPGKPK